MVGVLLHEIADDRAQQPTVATVFGQPLPEIRHLRDIRGQGRQPQRRLSGKVPPAALFGGLAEDQVDLQTLRIGPRQLGKLRQNEGAPQKAVQFEAGAGHRRIVVNPVGKHPVGLVIEAAFPEPACQLEARPHQIRLRSDGVDQQLAGETRLGRADPLKEPRFTGGFGTRRRARRLDAAAADRLRLAGHQVRRHGYSGARHTPCHRGPDLGLEIANGGCLAADPIQHHR